MKTTKVKKLHAGYYTKEGLLSCKFGNNIRSKKDYELITDGKLWQCKPISK